jgi:NAD-dependent SIR2 family protein deacetylase
VQAGPGRPHDGFVSIEVPVNAPGKQGALAPLLAAGGVVILSGAGLSTESGIPDYRGPTGAARRVTPMTHQEFRLDPVARHRYWARSFLGWPTIRAAQPNSGHRAVAALGAAGLLAGVITQNVDGLHRLAGSGDAIELHGGLDRVVCLSCRETTSRAELQQALTAANPGFQPPAGVLHPDGDVELSADLVRSFRMLDCDACGGPLKPDVVFFGDSVPADRVSSCFALVDSARALLVLGSSLTVYSGYRFAVRAQRRGLPIAIVNAGATRADHLAALRLDAPLGPTLSALVDAVHTPRQRGDKG